MLIKEVNGKYPQIPADCYVAENATIVGDVSFGSDCSVWFNAVIRGDVKCDSISSTSLYSPGSKKQVIDCGECRELP